MQNTDDSRDSDSTSPHAREDKASKDRQDELLLDAIRAGDESSFAELVRRYERSMIRLVRAYVGDSATAEEVVQETWLAVVKGLGEFKHRSSFKTWLFSILTNQARKRAARGAREAAQRIERPENEDATSEWFNAAGVWRTNPPAWGLTPESELLAKEAAEHIYAAISSLPVKQRIVITMRDLEGWTSEEVCDLMKITKVNQRVLLHFARTKVQQKLDWYFTERGKAPAGPGTEGSKQ